MGGTAPGRCSDCGNDAYIQLAGEAEMLCAHCYGKRMGIAPSPGRKGGEAAPKPTTAREAASPALRRLSRRASLYELAPRATACGRVAAMASRSAVTRSAA